MRPNRSRMRTSFSVFRLTVVFGGATSSGSGISNITWLYEDGNWLYLLPYPMVIRPRSLTAMAYYPEGPYVMAFGGIGRTELTELEIVLHASGRGVEAGARVDGAELFVWRNERWELVSSVRAAPAELRWSQLGDPGTWNSTRFAAGVGAFLFSIEQSGAFYATDPFSGYYRQLDSGYTSTMFMFCVHDTLFSIEANGDMYRYAF